MAALLIPALTVGLGIAVDAAWWRYRQAVLQHAADMVAMSLAMDVANGVTTGSALVQNGTNEARKHGCAAPSCTVAVTYPLGGDTTRVGVTISQPDVARFFSGVVVSSPRGLSARAAAQRPPSPGGSSCAFVVGSMDTSQNTARSLTVANEFTGCELMAAGTRGVAVEATGNVAGRLTSSRSVVNLGGVVGDLQEWRGNLTTPPSPPYSPGANLLSAAGKGCIEIGASVLDNTERWQPWMGDQRSKLHATRHGYSYRVDWSTQRIIQEHRFEGGGVFCGLLRLPAGTRLVLGSGTWFFTNLFLQGGEIDGTDRTVRALNPLIWTGGQQTDGVTLVVPRQSFYFADSLAGPTRIDIRAPTIGPYRGLALVTASDLFFAGPVNPVRLSNPEMFRWTGLVHLPGRSFEVLGNNVIGSPPGADGTFATSCSQLVVGALHVGAPIRLGNRDCAAMGLPSWGSQPVAGRAPRLTPW